MRCDLFLWLCFGALWSAPALRSKVTQDPGEYFLLGPGSPTVNRMTRRHVCSLQPYRIRVAFPREYCSLEAKSTVSVFPLHIGGSHIIVPSLSLTLKRIIISSNPRSGIPKC